MKLLLIKLFTVLGLMHQLLGVGGSAVSISGVISAENTYYQNNGVYFQILPNDGVPSYETGTVLSNLRVTLPPNMQVDIYTDQNGSGFYITQVDAVNSSTTAVGVGPEASVDTYTIKPTATST